MTRAYKALLVSLRKREQRLARDGIIESSGIARLTNHRLSKLVILKLAGEGIDSKRILRPFRPAFATSERGERRVSHLVANG